MFLAQANIATFRWPLDDSRMSEFVAQIDSVNQFAEQSDGFIWRFTERYSPRDLGPPWNNPLLFFNMSVWRDQGSLHAFLRSPEHLAVVRSRKKWVEPLTTASSATWWIEESFWPTVDNAIAAISLRSGVSQNDENGSSLTAEILLRFAERLERSVWQAVIAKDRTGLDQLFADDYIEITLDGKRVIKDEIVDESPQSDDIRAYALDSAKVATPGNGTVLLSYHVTIDGTFRGEPILPKDRWATSIWHCNDGCWKCGFFQQSPFWAVSLKSPWLSIPAEDYDTHMAHGNVQQRDLLDRVFAAAIAEFQPQRIALPGCGTGGGLEHVDPDSTSEVFAVDLNPGYLEHARQQHGERLPQLALLQLDLEACELPSEHFDLIYCALVLEYVRPEIVLEKFARWLTPNGILIVVLQLASDDLEAVSNTQCHSLQSLAGVMQLHDRAEIRDLANQVGLVEVYSQTEQLPSGRQFSICRFRRKKNGYTALH